MIVTDNFIALIRSAVFQEEIGIEPMSPFKWKQLLDLADRNGVSGIIYNAIEAHGIDTWLNIPTALATVNINYQNFADRIETTSEEVETLNKMLLKKHAISLTPMPLLSTWKQKRYVKIKESERHAIDTSIDTLQLLDIIITNVTLTERKGFSMPHLLTLGHFLRNQGDRVDYVKLETWLKKLHLMKWTSLFVSILVNTFEFEILEIPFLFHYYKNANKSLLSNIMRSNARNHIKHTYEFFNYSPLGMLSYWTTLTKESLNQIEE